MGFNAEDIDEKEVKRKYVEALQWAETYTKHGDIGRADMSLRTADAYYRLLFLPQKSSDTAEG